MHCVARSDDWRMPYVPLFSCNCPRRSRVLPACSGLVVYPVVPCWSPPGRQWPELAERRSSSASRQLPLSARRRYFSGVQLNSRLIAGAPEDIVSSPRAAETKQLIHVAWRRQVFVTQKKPDGQVNQVQWTFTLRLARKWLLSTLMITS